MDYYDVEAMIRNALIDERNVWKREANYLRRECDFIRRELRGNCDELLEEIRKFERTLASRTEHLA